MKGKKIIAPILCLASVATLAACSPVVTDGDNLNDLKTEHVEVVNTNQKLELSVASLNTEIATLKNEKTAIEAELADLDSKLETALNEKEVDAKTISELEASIDDLKQELNSKEVEINNLNERIKALQNQDFVWTDSGVTAAYDYKLQETLQSDIELNDGVNYSMQTNEDNLKYFVSFFPVMNGTGVKKEYVGYYKEYDVIKSVDISLKDKKNLLINQDSFNYKMTMDEGDTYENMSIYYIGGLFSIDENGDTIHHSSIGENLTSDDEVDLTNFFVGWGLPSGKYLIEVGYRYIAIINDEYRENAKSSFSGWQLVEIEYTAEAD